MIIFSNVQYQHFNKFRQGTSTHYQMSYFDQGFWCLIQYLSTQPMYQWKLRRQCCLAKFWVSYPNPNDFPKWRVYKKGRILFIYPEGTRLRANQKVLKSNWKMLKWRDGSALRAKYGWNENASFNVTRASLNQLKHCWLRRANNGFKLRCRNCFSNPLTCDKSKFPNIYHRLLP